MTGWRQNLRRWWHWRQSPGRRAERAAARHLRRSGYRVLGRNVQGRLGEIDIVAEDRRDRCIVIVEVKSGSADTPPPEVHVNPAKQRKLTALAADLVRRHRLEDRSVRFDVIGIVWPAGARHPSRLTHHQNAFEAAW